MAITLDGTTGITASGNITGNYILGNGSQLSGIITSVSSLSNGSSNVAVISSGGNVTVGVGGTPSVAVFSTAGANVAGTLGVTGNITGGNLSGTSIVGTLTTAAQTNITGVGTLGSLNVSGNANVGNLGTAGNITASYLFGNGSQLSGIDASGIQNGTSNVRVTSSGGNVTTSVGGQANVLTVTSTGANIAGTLNNGTGNANLGNLGATTVVATNLTGTLTTAAQTNITSVGTLGTLSVSGNITGGNLLINTDAVITGNLTVQGNTTTINSNVITTNDLNITVGNNQSTGAALNNAGIDVGNNNLATWRFNNATTSWQSNIAVMPTANGTLTLGGTSNYWGEAYVASLTASGNVTGGNLLTSGNIVDTGALSIITAASGNINLAPNGTNVLVATTTGANITGTLNVTGDVTFGGNLIDTGALTVSTSSNGNITLSPDGTGVVIINKNLINGQGNGVGNIGSATTYFNTVFAKATSAQYADLAEKYTADAEYAPGTVLHFGGSAEVTLCNTDMCARVAGVVTTDPAYLMNSHLESAHTAAIALQGRVPTKVMGTTRKGDMMVSTGNGYARAEANPKIGTVIGKALEDFDGDIGTIEVAVGRI